MIYAWCLHNRYKSILNCCDGKVAGFGQSKIVYKPDFNCGNWVHRRSDFEGQEGVGKLIYMKYYAQISFIGIRSVSS